MVHFWCAGRGVKLRAKRSWWVGLLVLACGLLPLGLRGAEPAVAVTGAGGLTRLLSADNAEVWVMGATTNQWRRAQAGEELRLGDRLKTGPGCRALLQLSDQSVIRVNELTTIQVQPPRQQEQRKPWLDLRGGSASFFSRERPREIQFSTPVATGAIRGTEFHLLVKEDGETQLALLEGAVELSNEQGSLEMTGGELATVLPGRAPSKTALIEATRIIQWAFYYPGVLDLEELSLSAEAQTALGAALAAYRSGDLPQAVRSYPAERRPATDEERVFLAALLLAVGQVDQAQAQLGDVATSSPLAEALRQMIAAVQFQSWTRPAAPELATAWLAESYYQQSHYRLGPALEAARAAVAKSPRFGFGWIRVAELEFGMGRTDRALAALERGLAESPRNAQGLALRGFMWAARNRLAEAMASFDEAIAVDGALGNAWLGRGLCKIRQRRVEEGRQDLQAAAALEAQRSILRSYLGKAFAQAGQDELARKELGLGQKLDPNDPTPWLYSALLAQSDNRINEAIHDLERSQELNDHRMLFRSRLLLDRDQAVRSANLALAYRDAGLVDWSMREATAAVGYDYANFDAHRFLANSYNALRGPTRFFNLRYEAPWTREELLANLLAPAGVGVLSASVSQQDYGALFEQNRLKLATHTQYFSSGDWAHEGSLYGMLGGGSYLVDSLYDSMVGQRPNNDLERLSVGARMKQQLTGKDAVYFDAFYRRLESGDVAQYYDQGRASATLRAKDTFEPVALAGYTREWQPGVRTLFLAHWMANELALTDPLARSIRFLKYSGATVTSMPAANFTLDYLRETEFYGFEAQQMYQTEANTLVAGAHYEGGTIEAATTLNQTLSGAGLPPRPFGSTQAHDLDRVSVYAYDTWRPVRPLKLTAGVVFDHLRYPLNADTPPTSSLERERDKVSPKAGLELTPWAGGTLRGAYTRSLGGVFHEVDYRLEPSQVAGFVQSYRSLAPESAAGLVPGAEFETWGAGLSQSFKSGTYVDVQAELLRSEGDRVVGVVTNATFFPVPDRASGARETLDFEERTLAVAVNQLVGREWSVGASYRLSHAELDTRFPDVNAVPAVVAVLPRDEEGLLQHLNLMAIFQHRCGFFSEFRSSWTQQNNLGRVPDRPGDDFWQHHFFVGYRFARRLAEVRLGVLNLTDQDYRLDPLNYYVELPRERTFTLSLKLNF
ncbi:MAG: hypothetical protein FJ387_29480 [Verrucomicrobia bacterium]|nr:hypothetical protein [Verrucomicrobiota bacterium]